MGALGGRLRERTDNAECNPDAPKPERPLRPSLFNGHELSFACEVSLSGDSIAVTSK